MKTKYLYFMLLSASLICWSACDKDNGISPDNPDDETNTLLFVTHQDSVEIAAQMIYRTLCITDSSMIEKLQSGEGVFEAQYGTLLHDATPTIRYVTANSFGQARSIFIENFLSPITFLDADTTASVIKLDLGQQGDITFSSENGEGNVAKIDINLKQLDDLTMIYFLKQEAWPQNSVRKIDQGNTFISSDGLNFICIKSAENLDGYLATFDQGGDTKLHMSEFKMIKVLDPVRGSENPNNLNPQYYRRETYTAYMNSTPCLANCEQLRYLQGFMYDNHGNAKEKAKEALRRMLSDGLLNAIYSDGKVFLCSDECWFKRTTNEYKYTDSYYWSPSNREVKKKTVKSTYIWGSNRFFVMKSSFRECRFEDWRFDSFNVNKTYITYYDVNMKQYNYVITDINPSWNYRNGIETGNFIRMRCIRFGADFDYEAYGLRKTDVFEKKTY